MLRKKIAIIGLGYVGLPLAMEFGKKRRVVGFDIDHKRIDALKKGSDATLEVTSQELKTTENIVFTNKLNDISECSIFIITVPTPVNLDKGPNLSPLISATEMVGSVLKTGDLVIYESTVYPGATEEVCIPILEKISNLVINKDFSCGYSPERINPGDKERHVTSIIKVTSGSSETASKEVDDLYKEIIKAGTHLAESIKIAEASKVIENTQRDLNIAFINQLSIIFNKLDIDTESVLKAAGTKWNFVPFRPGLVGGHCIGIDPYYLIHKSKEVGYVPELILTARKINEHMAGHLTNKVLDLMRGKGIKLNNANVLIMGFAFKENCPDIRNTRIVDVLKIFNSFGCNVDIFDPCVSAEEVKREYKIGLIDRPMTGKYDAIILALAHDEFKKYSLKTLKKLARRNHVLFDVKYMFDKKFVDGRL
jgi:UDP-N-acetyl-D-glucosamine/UDP-N-acetyl-D-galactosamine dehydrogenase